MFEAIGNFWTENAIGDKLYIGYAVLVGITVLMFLWEYISDNPKRMLDFITNANKKGCVAVGKMTCLTLHGVGGPQHFKAEYMYVVDGKRYFVTYQMAFKIPIDSRSDCMNADMLLLKLKPAMILFYDEKNPKKVMSKLEVFTSFDGIHQIGTPRKNVWRNTDKDWESPIDLVTY